MLDRAENNFSTTGFNSKLIPKEDLTMEVRSRRYGSRTMFDTAKNFRPANYHETTFRASYHKPKEHPNPTWRTFENTISFDNSSKLKVAARSNARASGYGSNRQEWDGTTWRTEKN